MIVRVTYAEKKYQPIQYHVFAVGPFFAEDEVRAGETIETATARLYAALEKVAAEAFRRELPIFLANAKTAIETARNTTVRT